MSIIIIAAIGSAIFLGLDYSAKSFRVNASQHYNDLAYHDIELISTLLLDGQDIEEIRNTEGVAIVEGVIQLDARTGEGDAKKKVVLVSATQDVNLPTVCEGTLPAAGEECAVDKDLAESFGWQTGDTIEITTDDSNDTVAEQADFVPKLKGGTFTITAIMQHPDRGNTNIPQDPYILLSRDAFEYDEEKGAFLKAEILVDKPSDMYRFSKDYEDCVRTVLSRLENDAETAAGKRTQRVRTLIQEKLDEKQDLLEEGKTGLSDAREELDSGWKALADGETELKDGQRELDEAKGELDAAAEQLAEGNKELESSRAELDAAKARIDSADAALDEAEVQLQNGRIDLENGWNELEDVKESIRQAIRVTMNDLLGRWDFVEWAGWQDVDVNDRSVTAMTFRITEDYMVDLNESPDACLDFMNDPDVLTDDMLREEYVLKNGTEEGFDADAERVLLYAAALDAADNYGPGYRTLQESCQTWDEGHAVYCSGLTDYYSRIYEFNAGVEEYNEGEALYAEALTAYENGLSEYQEKLELYQQGVKDLEEGRKTLEEKRAELEAGEVSYADGLSSYHDAAGQLSSAQKDLEAMAPCHFYFSNARGNASYNQVMEASQDLLNMKGTFAMMFVVIGAMVIFATVSKIVDEQRTLVGTAKAMGLFKREIFAKYLFFGVSATFSGIVLGILAARLFMTGFTLKGYNVYYRYDIEKSHLFIRPTLTVMALAVLLSVAAVSAACFRLLKDPAIKLMKETVPAGSRKEKKNAGSVKTLYSRLILLNMKTDLKRVIVTVISVAGCCALIVTGVTLKYAMTGAVKEQYQRIIAYDEAVGFDPSAEGAREKMEALLAEAGADYTEIYKTNILYRITNNQAAELMVGDVEAISRLYHLLDCESGAPLTEKGTAISDGVLIQRRIAEIYHLSEGDEFEIAADGTNITTVRVAGIFEHFIGNPMVMSSSYYQKIYDEPLQNNMFLLRLSHQAGSSAAEADALETLNEQFRHVPGFESITSAEEAKRLFDSSTGVVNALVMLFIFMGIAMAGVVLLNLTNMYILQKKNELTIMRINGFTVRETVNYVLRETVITTFLGIIFGVSFGSGLAYWIIRTMEKQFLQFDRGLSPEAWAAGIVMTIGLIAAVNVNALRPVRNWKLSDIR